MLEQRSSNLHGCCCSLRRSLTKHVLVCVCAPVCVCVRLCLCFEVEAQFNKIISDHKLKESIPRLSFAYSGCRNNPRTSLSWSPWNENINYYYRTTNIRTVFFLNCALLIGCGSE